ncbi:MAG: enoyl-CoA hydratase [Alphaproteobacteria bacterium]|nr:enoyl-CoA hydratase [Alphaproteobacteria bacterium]MBF0249201.1 enoyl-CoA hydratase [Alphaproteobacteria bacterium]
MTDSEQDSVTVDVQDHVAWLTLNRPAALNALSTDVLRALEDGVDGAARDRRVRVVVLRALGKAFSAGHDLKELIAAPDLGTGRAIFQACARVMGKIHDLRQPVIAQVDGIAAAAGCQLVAQCDLAIASTRSRFATSGINLGLFCATPAVPLSRAVGRKAAADMLFTGRFVDANEAQTLGLINRAVGAEVLDAEVENLALEIASKSPAAIQAGKRLLNAQMDRSVPDAYAIAIDAIGANLHFPDAQAGIRAFLEKRPAPDWPDPQDLD